MKKKISFQKRIPFIKRNKAIILATYVGCLLGVTVGILGTVSKENYNIVNSSKNTILVQIEEKEQKLIENTEKVKNLELKQIELEKKKKELIDNEKKETPKSN